MRNSVPPDSISSNSFSKLAIAVVLLVFTYLVLFVLLADFIYVLRDLPDDASYYFSVARHIAAGDGPTFDGINQTNGFQPLWTLLLAAIAFVYRSAPEHITRVYLVIQCLMLLYSGWLLYLVQRRLFPPYVLIINAILFAYLLLYSFVDGMESAVLVMLLASLYYSAYRFNVFQDHGKLSGVAFGILLGLTMLARLDLIFLGVTLCGFCLLRGARRAFHEQRKWIVTLIQIVLGASVVCIPYLLYNMHYFDAFAPISVHLKSSFPHISYSDSRLLHLGRRPVAIAAAALGYLVWMLIAIGRKRPQDSYHRVALTVLSLSILLHLVHTLLFVKWAVFDWHFVPYAFFAVLLPSEPAAFLGRYVHPSRHPKLVVLTTVIVVAAMAPRILGKTLLASLDSSFRVRSYKAAVWVRDNTHPADVFAMKDAGHFGFFSERSTINLDGVVNNVEYQEALRDQQLGVYLKKNDVRYLVQHNMKHGDRTLLAEVEWTDGQAPDSGYVDIVLRYKSQLFGVYSDPITVRRNCEIYRSEPYPSPRSFLPLVIWRIADCDTTSRQYQ